VRSILLSLLVFVVVGTAHGDDAALLRSHELTGFDGSKLTLEQYEGRVVVVNFWASWCIECKKELPVLQSWDQAWSDDEVAFVAVSVDLERRKAERFIHRAKLDLPFYHDGINGLARALDLPALPCTYVLAPDGSLAVINQGTSDEELAQLKSKIEALKPAANTARR